MTQLLVSVRNTTEALTAIAGGAGLIDIKEPSNGSLGRAPLGTIRDIIALTAGKTPVSAALGELADGAEPPRVDGLSYVKWGPAGHGRRAEWRNAFLQAYSRLREWLPATEAVAVAYADWQVADAPMPQDICEVACTHGCKAFLLDTWRKDSTTLLDWLSIPELAALVKQCRMNGVRIALAGRLAADEIARLRFLKPDWFAVRSAVCRGGVRERSLAEEAVRELTGMLAGD
jgi:uncharacterized protein (UPF0264 family)